MIKKQIGGVLGLGCAPVITLLEWGNNLAGQRVSLFEQLPQNFGPIGLQLLVHQRLSCHRIS
jgi:hypothetical protein